MKVKVYRQTGKPLDIEKCKMYEQEFKNAYDILWEKKQKDEVSIDYVRDSLIVVEAELAKKYPIYDEVELPNSAKKWKQLQMTYQSPITVAIAADTNELTLFIMDAEY